MDVTFPPTRAAGLDRLATFVPHAGRDYTAGRNYDRPGHPHVSTLSPFIRHRILTEEEVLQAVLARHAPSTAEKFIQEVYWRTYWKGWLEMRPDVWRAYQGELTSTWNRVQTEGGLRADWEAACLGRTGISGFDDWAQELVRTGYLHNHARMWFASIWIFTLRLPWVLGADFFLRHLLDGDPASNTLSWRWVAGLQTVGKTYLARVSNISKYTDGRYRPLHQLAPEAPALQGPPLPERRPIRVAGNTFPEGAFVLLVTEDDLSATDLLPEGRRPSRTLIVRGDHRLSPLQMSPATEAFRAGAIEDFATREAAHLGPVDVVDQTTLDTHLRDEPIVTAFAPVGPSADLVSRLKRDGRSVTELRRAYDSRAWPYATAGFFKFKQAIPALNAALSRQPDLPGLAGGRL